MNHSQVILGSAVGMEIVVARVEHEAVREKNLIIFRIYNPPVTDVGQVLRAVLQEITPISLTIVCWLSAILICLKLIGHKLKSDSTLPTNAFIRFLLTW